MKRINLVLGFALLFAVACNSEKKAANSDSTSAEGTDTTAVVDTAAMNKAWAEYMTPGDSHQMLAKADGKWDA